MTTWARPRHTAGLAMPLLARDSMDRALSRGSGSGEELARLQRTDEPGHRVDVAIAPVVEGHGGFHAFEHEEPDGAGHATRDLPESIDLDAREIVATAGQGRLPGADAAP